MKEKYRWAEPAANTATDHEAQALMVDQLVADQLVADQSVVDQLAGAPSSGLERCLAGHSVRGALAANDAFISSATQARGTATCFPPVLIVNWDGADCSQIRRLFEKRGYSVDIRPGVAVGQSAAFGAIVHAARSASSLEHRLKRSRQPCFSGDWALIARDNIDNIHCIVQLTPLSTTELKAYVHSLWAMCSIT